MTKDTVTQQTFDLSGRSLMVSIPAYDHKVTVKTAIAMAQLTRVTKHHGIGLQFSTICGCSVVSRARNLLADRFLRSDCTDLLFVDADIGFKPEDVMRMMAWGIDHAIVAGIPRARKTKLTYITTLDQDDNHLIMNGKGLVRAHRVATAFMLVQRKVFETMKEAHPEMCYKEDQSRLVEGAPELPGEMQHAFFDFKVTPEGYVGEDFVFCDRARELGFEIWIDPTIKLTHQGIVDFESDFGKDILYPMITPVDSLEASEVAEEGEKEVA